MVRIVTEMLLMGAKISGHRVAGCGSFDCGFGIADFGLKRLRALRGAGCALRAFRFGICDLGFKKDGLIRFRICDLEFRI